MDKGKANAGTPADSNSVPSNPKSEPEMSDVSIDSFEKVSDLGSSPDDLTAAATPAPRKKTKKLATAGARTRGQTARGPILREQVTIESMQAKRLARGRPPFKPARVPAERAPTRKFFSYTRRYSR
jgi:hypothetical protein